MKKPVVELAVQDYDKPMGEATYRPGTGILTTSTKQRLEELEETKSNLEVSIRSFL